MEGVAFGMTSRAQVRARTIGVVLGRDRPCPTEVFTVEFSNLGEVVA
jgi:hypothetical protein